MTALSAASTPLRHGGTRLSIATRYTPCRELENGGEVPRFVCGDESVPDSIAIDVARRSTSQLEASVSSDALHASGVITLLYPDSSATMTTRAIERLTTLTRLERSSAAALVDLSSAYQLRAEQLGMHRDLFASLDAAAQALEVNRADPIARFDIAIALDRLGLMNEAINAWRSYLSIDSTSQWADEAKVRLASLAAVAQRQVNPPSADATPADVKAFCTREPQAARELGFDVVLPAWANATLRGDVAEAERELGFAGLIGAALVELRRDASVADAHTAIRSATLKARQRLVRAHAAYGRGVDSYRAPRFADARRAFGEAAKFAAPSRALVGWSTAYRGVSTTMSGDPAGGAAELRVSMATVDTMRYPALAGRIQWRLGTTLHRMGRSEEALTAFRRAAAFFDRAGEREYLGAAYGLEMQATGSLGDRNEMYRSMFASMRALRAYRASTWTHGMLYVASTLLADDGLLYAAEMVQREGVQVSKGTGRPVDLAEASLGYARLLALSGATAEANSVIASSAPLVAAAPAGNARRWLSADLSLSRAMITHRGQDAAKLSDLDSVVAFFGAPAFPARLVPALMLRAGTRLSRGDSSGAAHDLDRAVAQLNAEENATTAMPLRAQLLQSARDVFDVSIMLRVRRGDSQRALAELERARSVMQTWKATAESAQPSVPAYVSVVDIAVVGDTVLAWTLRSNGRSFAQWRVPRDSLARELGEARAALELGVSTSAADSILSVLHGRIIKPIERSLGPAGGELVFVLDGDLAGIPFAALRDGRRGRYLVEDYSVRYAASLRDAVGSAAVKPRAEPHALLIGDPAFRLTAFPGFSRLSGARAEVDSLSLMYAGASVLLDSGATVNAVSRAFAGAEIIHYAGHAIADVFQPLRSFLLLAPDSASSSAATSLSARDIARLDLRGVRMAVLSACEAVFVGNGHAMSLEGLSGAFLAAGARGVVASLWRIDDRRTTPFMLALHRSYRSSGNAAHALRDAQLAMLHSSSPELRSPSTWASFRYSGQ